ncbi:MAG: bifunctional 4-hydroxy-2-oxoglutarate aldolase/2-dehydro-3-deoxy-phosphogluconate aldolase [Paracoccaceae bacterium]|jgi:2-dehydro-3-deoxyphosphogluconate aldolase/(4S)-4-hydroxy-2-oxoglutarate aldolase|tara:strand:+ start:231 stop:872 length:642 start_codon:yes stop_codon:yes gene_type:complete
MTPEDACKFTDYICRLAPVIPVLVIEDATIAEPLAEALVSGGLPTLEVTLRSAAALDAIKAMSKVAGATVGAGTLLSGQDVRAAKEAGAVFGVSPGATDALLQACEDSEMPLLPGAATATEVMRLMERGYRMQKFFPAEASGGPPALKSIGGPLPQVTFCPTGGIGVTNAATYLQLSNTVCVGGSWVAPKSLVEKHDWQAIEALAQQAARMLD